MSEANRKPIHLVLCEGHTDVMVMERIAAEAGIHGLTFRSYDGKSKLTRYLQLERDSPAFAQGRIRRILVTRDADDDWATAWTEALGAVSTVFDTRPAGPALWQAAHHGPKIAIWIAPGPGRSGMIESLCLEAAAATSPATFACLEHYRRCLAERHSLTLHEKERFAIWTLTAQSTAPSRRRLPFVKAITQLDFAWDHPTFDEIRTLLRQTAPGDLPPPEPPV